VIEDAFIRGYVAQRNADSERREFVPEDALPNQVLSDLLRVWSLAALTTVWAVLADEDAEAVREENHWRFVVWPETDGQVTKQKGKKKERNARQCPRMGAGAT
jgi:hypothetical protein